MRNVSRETFLFYIMGISCSVVKVLSAIVALDNYSDFKDLYCVM